MVEAQRWICPSCQRPTTTPFCATCGEEPLAARDLSLRGLVEKAIHALTSIDARAARTAWTLLRHPGQLTLAWISGVRRAYVAPFQLFLIANVLFFALQSLTGENVFSSTLESHLHHQDWSDLAQTLVNQRLQVKGIDLARYEPEFDRAVVLNAKSLILLMTVPFALLLPLVFVRERRPFMTHVVFSLHLYTYLLLVFCLALLAARISAWLGWGGLQAPMVDNVISVANLVACGVYVHLAIGPVYRATGLLRAGRALLLTLAAAIVVVGYRFALFLITLYAV